MRRRELLPLLVLIGIFAVLPLFLPNRYYTYVVNRGFANATAVIGLVILFGIAGQISLGHVAFFALSAYCSAILSMSLGWPPILSMFAGISFACVWGAILSVPAFKLSGPFLSICTVAFGEVVRLLVINLEPITNGPYGLYNIPKVTIFGAKIIGELQWYYILLAFIAILIVAALRLKNSYLGRALAAVREDETAAGLMGVNIRRLKTLAFVCAAFFAGVAGCLYTYFAGFLSPEIITGEQSFNLFSMAVVGGQESVVGGVAAGVALTVMPELMRFLQEYYIMIFSLIVLLIVLLPLDAIKDSILGWLRPAKKAEISS